MKNILFIFFIFTCCYSYIGYFNSADIEIEYNEFIDLKKYDNEYKPQGICWVNDNLLAISVHKNNKESYIMLFKNKKLKLNYKLPKDATHTSDLECFNDKIYALDYHSNKIYIFNISDENLNLLKEVKLDFTNTGSACIIKTDNILYYAMSRFLKSNKIYFIPLSLLYEKNQINKEDVAFTQKTTYFTQGLFCNKDKIYITVNALGKDIIQKYKIKDKKLKLLEKYSTPTTMIEDITIKNNIIYTSGENKNENIVYESQEINEI